MLNRITNKGKKTNGQGMVELALTLPLFLLLVYGIFEVGRLIFIYSAVLNASRDAARYAAGTGVNPSGVEYYRDCGGIKDRAERVSAIVDLTASDAVTIYYDNPSDGTTIASSCESLGSDTKIKTGNRVVVTVKASFDPIVPLFNITDIPISSTTARSVINELDIWEKYD